MTLEQLRDQLRKTLPGAVSAEVKERRAHRLVDSANEEGGLSE